MEYKVVTRFGTFYAATRVLAARIHRLYGGHVATVVGMQS